MTDDLKSMLVQNGPYVVGGGLVLACVVIVAIAMTRAADARRRAIEDLAARELAIITEDIRATGGGALSFLLLLVAIFVSVVSYNTATTVFQQIEAGVGFIGSAIIFGLGIALGRRRTYTVYRSPNRQG